MTLKEFLDDSDAKLEELINQYPDYIPVCPLADFLHCEPSSVRGAIKSGQIGLCGKNGSKWWFLVPTAKFVRWYREMKSEL